MRAALLILLASCSWAGEAFGVWTLNPARSSPAGNEKVATLRFEPHTRGEVFTVDIRDTNGRASTFSTILYLDGSAREFRDPNCAGTQLSRRVDGRTVEIVRECAGGQQIRLVRRALKPGVLVFEITERNPDGRRSERRLVWEKH